MSRKCRHSVYVCMCVGGVGRLRSWSVRSSSVKARASQRVGSGAGAQWLLAGALRDGGVGEQGEGPSY